MTMTQEERISRLEGAHEVFSYVVANMVTKDELRSTAEMLRAENQATLEALRTTAEALRAEQRATTETLRAEQQASENRLRAEMRAAELRIIRWNVGTIFGAAAIIIAALKLLP